ncbi:synapse differentiation-inducing gene protein 1-like [Pimephales promelas]|uniref:synapse differentiation-inducing gene protein 1-like n=1 Tax=Pimephales promelas TaxID=90988 RepID=UPI001955DBCB|nr:synapse differentiation-inducing gene protein 1-like [Pimephales promelas]
MKTQDGRFTSKKHETKEIPSTREEMYNQGPVIGRINPSFSGAPDDPSQKPWMGQPVPPGSYPNTSGYPSQPYAARTGPQGPYPQQQQLQSMSIYPQRLNAGHTGVTVQPTVFMTSTTAPVYMSDYLCYSIFTLLFCFFPLGFAAIIFSASTRDANMAGRQDLAIRSSRTALVLNNVALGIGLTIYTVTTMLVLWMYGVIK